MHSISFHAEGNFCIYPREGDTVARFEGVSPMALCRAAKALGMRTGWAGKSVVVGRAQGYDARPQVGREEQAAAEKVATWLAAHPEAEATRPEWRKQRVRDEFNGPATWLSIESSIRKGDWLTARFHRRWHIMGRWPMADNFRQAPTLP